MKTVQFYTLSVLLISAVFARAGTDQQTNAVPLLVLKGYEGTGTNRHALLELHNTTRDVLWLRYFGSDSPLAAPLLEDPAVPPPLTISPGTNGPHVYSVTVGSFFSRGERVDPGGKLRVSVPVIPGQPAKRVGLAYYLGNFNDGNDFLNHLGTPLLDKKATSDERRRFEQEQARRRLKAPVRREVWCSQPVS